MAASPLLATIIIQYIGYTILFCADGIGTALFCLFIFFGLPETRPVVSDPAVSRSIQQIRPRGVWRDGRFLLFTGLSFLLTSIYFQSLSTLPADMQTHGLDAVQYGITVSVNGIVVILLGLPLSHFLARFASFKALAVSALLLGGGFGLTVLADYLLSFPLYAGSVLVWTLGEIIFVPVSATIVTLLSPTDQRGLYQGVARTSWGLSACAGPLLGGVILQTWGSVLWIGCAALGCALAGCFLLLGRRQSSSPHQEKVSPASLAEEMYATIVQTILTGKVSVKALEPDGEVPHSAELASCEMLSGQPPASDTASIMVLSPEMEVYLANRERIAH